jgi:hypothetical protein
MPNTEDYKKILDHAHKFSMKLACSYEQLPTPAPAAHAAPPVVSFPLLGYRGSSLVSLNEVHAYLETCGTIEDAVEICGKLLYASR